MSEENDIVRCGLIQLANPINDESVPVADIQEAMFQEHIPYIEEAGKRAFNLCLPRDFQRSVLLSLPGPSVVRRSRGGSWTHL